VAQSVAVDPNGEFNKFTGEPSINEILKAFSRKRGKRIKKYLLSFHNLRDDPESLLVHEYASEAYESNPSIILAPSVLSSLMRIYSKWVPFTPPFTDSKFNADWLNRKNRNSPIRNCKKLGMPLDRFPSIFPHNR